MRRSLKRLALSQNLIGADGAGLLAQVASLEFI
jgi:hypothetical protein